MKFLFILLMLLMSCSAFKIENNITLFTIGGEVTGLKGTVTVVNNGVDEKTITENGNFVFDKQYPWQSEYNIIITNSPFYQSCVVNNSNGTVLSFIEDVLIQCNDKQWIFPSSLSDDISPGGQSASTSQVAMNDNGDAIIVWQQSDGVNEQIFKAEYRNGQWIVPSSLSDNISPDGYDAQIPQVAMSNNGNAIIVWQQNNGSNDQIYKAEYRNGQWTLPSSISDSISPNGQNAQMPQVAMDNQGNAIIVWKQSDSNNDQIYKAEYRNGQWTFPADLSDHISISGQPATMPQVAINDNGNAIIVWQQSNGGTLIFYSKYNNGIWDNPTDLSDNVLSVTTSSSSNPQVAMDNNGNIVVTWFQENGTDYNIYKAEYRNGQWTKPIDLNDKVNPDGASAFYSQVAMNDNGDAIIVWQQSNGANTEIYKAEYHDGQWTLPSISDYISPAGQDALTPQVSMDNNNQIIVVWQQSDGSNDQIYKAEYRNGEWVLPSIDINISPDGQNAASSQVAMSNNGNAIIVWVQSNGSDNQVFKAEYK